ncbi:MAG: hypothetical protein IPM97_11095 [Bdellovibrionaceae bacterium]|nr:hypothetical protein [Pseudobdellovibrionaceae bacterium]
MNVLKHKKKEWEYQNEQVLLKLVEASTDVSIESVKKAGLITSFLAYILYKLLGVMLAFASALLRGPQLIRYTSPEKIFESVDISADHAEVQMQSFYQKR